MMTRTSTPPVAALAARPEGQPRPEPLSDAQVGLPWLWTLRWGAAVGQLALILIGELAFGGLERLELLLGLAACTALSNLAFTRLRFRAEGWLLPAVLVLDVVLLTSMLAVSGGASNPFSVFFLVHVALAAVLLRPLYAWGMVALTVAAFGALFALPTGPHEMHAHGGGFSAHLWGMWVAFALAASFVAYFIGRVTTALKERDRRLAEMAELAAQNERLASLSVFSANAAHELGSPLGTIALAAGELAGTLTDADARADAELVCDEVARCRAILADLSSRAGESMGEMPAPTTASAIVDRAVAALPPAYARRLEREVPAIELVAPVATLAQMLHNLVRNAFEASDADAPVHLGVEALDGAVRFVVSDRGAGLAPEVAERLGTPFVSTKAEGLGLGVYLVRSYAERAGGDLRVAPRPGGGTRAELTVRRDVRTSEGR